LYRLPSDLSAHLQNGGTLIVPTRQHARALQLAHAAARLEGQERVWASADILSANAWLRREALRAAQRSPAAWPRLLAASEEWYLWRISALEATQHLVLLDSGALGAALERAAELAALWEIALQPAAAGSEAALLYDTQRAFGARCRALGAAGVSSLLARVATPESMSQVLWRGFDALPPALRAGAGTARAHKEAPAPLPPLHLAHDAQEEAAHIAAWCQARIAANCDARLLVIAPGAPGERERLTARIRQALDPAAILDSAAGAASWVAQEGGEPLAQQPLIAQALTTLEFLSGATLEFEALCAWLRAPQWAQPAPEARAALALTLRARGLASAGLRDFLGALRGADSKRQGAARELTTQLQRAAAALKESGASARSWSERIDACLALAGWPGTMAPGAAAQALQRWHELLEEFGALTATAGTLGAGAAIGLLRDLAQATAWRCESGDVSVTVSPQLSDPVVHYDGIWVAGLTAQAFPQPVAPNAFLPLAAQRAAGVPAASAAGRLAQAQGLLAAWSRASDELVFSAATHAQDLELLPTPLLASRPFSHAPALKWLPASLARQGQIESGIDERGLPWTIAKPLTVRPLELQNTCPFLAYAEMRLGSVRPENLAPGVAANRRGDLLHRALEQLWRRLGDSHGLAARSAEALAPLIAECVEHALQQVLTAPLRRRRRGRRELGQLDLFTAVPPIFERERQRAERLIASLCELERRRAPFRVAQLETNAQFTLAGATLTVRPDRVDELASGGRAVLDYKTGKRSSPDWYGERPSYPQLLVYAAALGEEVAALANVHVSTRALRFDAIARDAPLVPGRRRESAGAEALPWPALQGAWRERIAALVRAFLAGEAQVDPKPDACKYCHVIDICRIGASSADTQEDEGPPESTDG
jgi:ATP-dependent helicase/nuclease subunit B